MREGIPFFINARTDPFWNKVAEPGACFEIAVERASAYAAAGADGIFVPGVLEPGIEVQNGWTARATRHQMDTDMWISDFGDTVYVKGQPYPIALVMHFHVYIP